MRLFSPITKAKYQHEIQLRQSEWLDCMDDPEYPESSMENEADLSTMLRVFRAVSPP
jgi:hypothetical protein